MTKIKQLFRFGPEQFMSGISSSVHIPKPGLFYKASGVNTFLSPYYGSPDAGLMQIAGDPTLLRGDELNANDNLWNGVTKVGGSVSSLFVTGSNGGIYATDLVSDTSLSAWRIGGSGSAIASPAIGLGIFKPQNENEMLYYWQLTKIGRWRYLDTDPYFGVSGPGQAWNDDWATTLTTVSNGLHPTHFFQGQIFYGNKNYIGKIHETYVTAESGYLSTTSVNVLDFPPDFTVTTLEDDGNYLVIGITTNAVGISDRQAINKIIFWDTLEGTLSPNKEYLLPEFSITSIVKYDKGFLAFGTRGMYYFDVYNSPIKVKNLSVAEAPVVYYPYAVDRYSDAAIFGGDKIISSYGRIIPEAPVAYTQPFKGIGIGTVSYINADSRFTRIYVAGNDSTGSAFYAINAATGGGTTTTFPETTYIDLGEETVLTRIDVILGEPLADGDRFTLQTQADEDTSATDYGALTYEKDGAIKRKNLFKEVHGNQIKLLFNFTTGSVKIKNIIGYGYPANY